MEVRGIWDKVSLNTQAGFRFTITELPQSPRCWVWSTTTSCLNLLNMASRWCALDVRNLLRTSVLIFGLVICDCMRGIELERYLSQQFQITVLPITRAVRRQHWECPQLRPGAEPIDHSSGQLQQCIFHHHSEMPAQHQETFLFERRANVLSWSQVTPQNELYVNTLKPDTYRVRAK